MKLLPLLLLSLPMVAQTVNVGTVANPPDVTAAINAYLTTQQAGVNALVVGAILVGDVTVQLPPAISTACSEPFLVTAITSTANVTTATLGTVNVPIGTQVSVTQAATAAYNTTFVTTSAASQNPTLTWALTIADGTYSNPSPQTTGYPVLTYARCAVVVDSEVIGINGTTNGTTYAAIRGDMGTAPSAHNAASRMYLLTFHSLRGWYRARLQYDIQQVIASQGTARINTLIAQKAAIDVQIAAIQAAIGR